MSAHEGTPVTVDFRRLDYRGRVQILLHVPGSTYTDKLDVLRERDRRSFSEKVLEKYPGLDSDGLTTELDRIAAAVAAECKKHDEEDPDSDAGSADKDRLVQIATNRDLVELFHTPGRHDADAFATFTQEGVRESFSIRSKAFEQLLVRSFYTQYGDVPGSQSVRDAIVLIGGLALYQGSEHEIHLRFAEHEGEIWFDLGTDDAAAVCVTRSGWSVIASDRVPVRFIRRRGMKALPYPVAGGSIGELRSFVNLPSDESWHLYLACLLAYMRPRGPYPILIVNGEQGSAKSTLCKLLRLLIDPNKSPLRRPPKDVRDLMIGASNGWVVGFDNLSGIQQELSDSICSLATGGGFAVRELYTDGEEKLFDASRPVILNGIEDLAARPDLLDRAVTLSLPRIGDRHRRDEESLYQQFDLVRPRLIGALLDALSAALRELPGVHLDSMPRMADFARFAVAAESGLLIPRGAFLRAYTANRAESHVAAVEASIIGQPILELMQACARWEGTCQALLDELERTHADQKTQGRREWPKSGRGLRAALTRIAPTLCTMGITVTPPIPSAGGNRDRILVLERVDPDGGDRARDDRDDRDDLSPISSQEGDGPTSDDDGGISGDGPEPLHTLSDEGAGTSSRSSRSSPDGLAGDLLPPTFPEAGFEARIRDAFGAGEVRDE